MGNAVRWLWLAVIGCSSLFWSATSHAWTKAAVTSAQLSLNLNTDARVQAELRLDVSVYGGAVHSIELAGLAPNLQASDISFAQCSNEDAKRFLPNVEQKDAQRFRLIFSESSPPEEGNYHCTVKFSAQLGASQVEKTETGKLLVSWTLPAWKYNLQDVSIRVNAPAQSTALTPPQAAQQNMQVEQLAEGESTQMIWKRTHLLRNTPWTIQFWVPQDSLAIAAAPDLASLAQEPPGTAAQGLLKSPLPENPISNSRFNESALGFGLILLMLAWIKYALARIARPQSANHLERLIVAAASACIVIGSLVFTKAVLASWFLWTTGAVLIPAWLALCPIANADALSLTSNQPLDEAKTENRARWLLWLDISSVFGLLTLCLLLVTLFALPLFQTLNAPLAALLLLPSFFLATRDALPVSFARKQEFLQDFIEKQSWWYFEKPNPQWAANEKDSAGECLVSLGCDAVQPGTLQLYLHTADNRWGPFVRSQMQLTALTRMSSEASDAMAAVLGTPLHKNEHDGTLTWCAAQNDIAKILKRLRRANK